MSVPASTPMDGPNFYKQTIQDVKKTLQALKATKAPPFCKTQEEFDEQWKKLAADRELMEGAFRTASLRLSQHFCQKVSGRMLLLPQELLDMIYTSLLDDNNTTDGDGRFRVTVNHRLVLDDGTLVRTDMRTRLKLSEKTFFLKPGFFAEPIRKDMVELFYSRATLVVEDVRDLLEAVGTSSLLGCDVYPLPHLRRIVVSILPQTIVRDYPMQPTANGVMHSHLETMRKQKLWFANLKVYRVVNFELRRLFQRTVRRGLIIHVKSWLELQEDDDMMTVALRNTIRRLRRMGIKVAWCNLDRPLLSRPAELGGVKGRRYAPSRT